jgi:hypothetical protein
MFNFGAGRARLIPPGGGQPVELGVVQSSSVELKVDLKELRGPYRYPIQVADGKGTASGKVNFALFWPQTLAAITAGTLTNGAGPTAVIGEAHTVGATPYHVTLTNASTMVVGSEVVGLIDATGNPVFYSRVAGGSEASSSTAGQAGGAYSIASGVLTFASADTLLNVQVSYLYTPSSDVNTSEVALTQIGLNSSQTFQLTLIGSTDKNGFTNQAQQFIVQFNACLAPSMKFDQKMDDWTYIDLDFQAYCDANGNLGSMYLVNPGGVAIAA